MSDKKQISRTARMFQLVLEGYSNEAAVAVIKKEYGKEVETNTNSIGWCRTQLKAKTKYAKKHNPKGISKILTDREARNTKASKAVAISKLAAQSKVSTSTTVATAAHKK